MGSGSAAWEHHLDDGGRGVADRQRSPPPTPPQMAPLPPAPSVGLQRPPRAMKCDLSNCKLVTCKNVTFFFFYFGGNPRNIMTLFNAAVSGRCILDGTHIKAP